MKTFITKTFLMFFTQITFTVATLTSNNLLQLLVYPECGLSSSIPSSYIIPFENNSNLFTEGSINTNLLTEESKNTDLLNFSGNVYIPN